MNTSDWQTRWATEADTEALLNLFARCFDAPMTREEWAWKYRDTSSPGVVCLDGDTIIAFNGGMPRPIQFGGRQLTAVQMGDVMVDPRYRGILTRRGPFYQVVHRFFSEKVGETCDYRYAFGFPHARHTRLGSALKLYCDTDRIVEATWQSAPKRRWLTTATPLQQRDAATVDRLWQAMAPTLAPFAVGKRDGQWLQQRYVLAPGKGYVCWRVFHRLTRQTLGVCVLRQHTPKTVELLDIVAPTTAMAEVVACARHITSRMGATKLIAWMTPAVANALERTSAVVSETEVVVPGSQVNGLPLGQEPHRHWWLMGGDTDFR